MRTRRDLEHVEQTFLVEWARLRSGSVPELRLLFAIPNFAGRLGKATALHGARLKAEGRKPGVPDLCLPVARRGFHGLYIELKAGKNTATPEQLAWIEALNAQGYHARCCTGWESARETLSWYLGLSGDAPC